MSLILEALRKSEAERQRGRAPGLFVEQQALQRRERRGATGWAIAGPLLLVLLLLGWGWREWRRDEAVAPDAGPTRAPVAAAPAVPPATSAAPAFAPAGAATDAAMAVATGAPAPAASVADPPAAMAVAPPGPPDLAVAPPANPASMPPPAAALDPATLPMLPAAVADPVAEVAAGAATAPPPVPDAATSPPRDGVGATDAPTVDEALPRLADLPPGERAALPPLRLSMHVYSDEPARRFVIVDERRLTEGATPAPGLVVEQIRRDGAVLSINGRRVLLPRP